MGATIPEQRWQIPTPDLKQAIVLAEATGLSPIITQVMINRGIRTPAAAQAFLDPDAELLNDPLVDFPDLTPSLDILEKAIRDKTPIAICGDYDADGMTSTALLMRALRYLGADVNYAIPSRMAEGYGINERIVEDFHAEGVGVILTVDNGIAAVKPVARARELGLQIIITDHHDVPPIIPNANAILNPKLIDEASPYRTMAGVGVAYLLALCLADRLGKASDLRDSLLELFTLGTIADLAALTGVNRRWVRRGLHLLARSQVLGIQALVQISGLGNEKNIKPEAIGFRLGPRINAIGRIGDPQTVIEMLTTDDEGIALERAMQCEQVNKQRQTLCEEITVSAVEHYEQSEELDARKNRILMIVCEGWHHGVIGIVASRLVERYGVPVFIGTYEDDGHIRGSARSIPEFNVFEALEYCKDLTIKHGGHKAAGGFSLASENLAAMQTRLSEFAHLCLEQEHLKPLVNVDVEVFLSDIDMDLYQEIDCLHPCGMENPDPVFWSRNVRVLEQRLIGKNHLRLTVMQEALAPGAMAKKFTAIAWRWGEYYPMPKHLDIAYRLRTNEWQGEVSLQLEVIGVRLPQESSLGFVLGSRQYRCMMVSPVLLQVSNDRGDVLTLEKGHRLGVMNRLFKPSQEVDVTQPPYYDLVKAAVACLRSGD
jgi:single-stranded-DNA-specific exonuclease